MRHRIGHAMAILVCVTSATIAAQQSSSRSEITPAASSARQHIAEAMRLAGDDRTRSMVSALFNTLRLSKAVDQSLLPPTKIGAGYRPNLVTIEPVKIFDNFYYVGNEWVGVFLLKTPAGVVQWDAMASEADARNVIEPGYRKLGIDPKTIRYLILTHGHWDHYAGAAYLTKKYPNMQIMAGKADWDLMTDGPFAPRSGQTLPARGADVTDGQQLRLGSTTIELYVTPGHTPGTVSSIVAVKNNGRTHRIAIFGGMGAPTNLRSNAGSPGLMAYDAAWQAFGRMALSKGVQGVVSTHPAYDGTLFDLAASRRRSAASPNPWLIGEGGFRRYLAANHKAVLAIRDVVTATGSLESPR